MHCPKCNGLLILKKDIGNITITQVCCVCGRRITFSTSSNYTTFRPVKEKSSTGKMTDKRWIMIKKRQLKSHKNILKTLSSCDLKQMYTIKNIVAKCKLSSSVYSWFVKAGIEPTLKIKGVYFYKLDNAIKWYEKGISDLKLDIKKLKEKTI